MQDFKEAARGCMTLWEVWGLRGKPYTSAAGGDKRR